MKYLYIVSCVTALLLPVSVSSGQSQRGEIVVEATTLTSGQWVTIVGTKLERALKYPSFFSNEVPASGIVSVRFNLNDANQPTAVFLTRKSGSRRLDQAGLRAISRMDRLPGQPATFRPNQHFIANILFAASEEENLRQLSLLRREARSLRASLLPDNDEVALVITTGARNGS